MSHTPQIVPLHSEIPGCLQADSMAARTLIFKINYKENCQ